MNQPEIDVYVSDEKLVKANGIELNYQSFGKQQDPVILLIMGLGTQMIFWDEDFCRLLAAKGFRVIRFDNRDIGKSTWLSEFLIPSAWQFISSILFRRRIQASYLIDDMADDALGLLKALNISQAHVVGASMGGMIAQAMAIKAPHAVASLCSIMSTTGNRRLPTAKARVGATMLKPIGKSKQTYISQGIKVWRVLNSDHYAFDESKVISLLSQSWERSINVKGVARQLAAILGSGDRSAKLEKLALPCLVIHGDADPLLPVECGIATAKAIPDARLKIYKGMGHTFPIELWDEIVNDITSVTK